MKERDDKDMLGVLNGNRYEAKKKNAPQYKLDSKRIKELVASKDVVKVKNGVIQIDPSHPDYDFLDGGLIDL